MNAFFPLLLSIVGTIGGFVLGQLSLLYILKGENLPKILEQRKIRFLLGALVWLIAIVGALLGWQAGQSIAST